MVALCMVVKPPHAKFNARSNMRFCVKATEHAIALHEDFLYKRDDVLYYDEIWVSAITLANQQNVALQSKNSWSPTKSK